MTPVVLLTAVYPLITSRFDHAQVGGVPELTLLIAGSLLVPWLGQACGMPVFAALCLDATRTRRKLAAKLIAHWPYILVTSLPLIGVASAGVTVALHWSATAGVALAVLLTIHVALMQALAVSIFARAYRRWALAWIVYAAALLAAPRLWWLPALAALATQGWHLVRMAAKAKVSIRPKRLPRVWSEFGKGALVGSVLWADKVFLFLQHPGDFDSRLVFAALLPGVIIYNYFFVYVAPQVDGVASSVRDLLQVDDLDELRTLRDRYVGRLETAVAMCAVRGATLGAVSIVGAAAVAPGQAYEFAVLVAFTWCLVLVSVCVYKLSYLGQIFVPYATCAACLLLLALTFAVVTVGTGAYIVLAVILALALLPLLHHLAKQWRTPEYALFWQRATSW